MIRLKIDVKKIDKSALFAGAKGTYCDLTLMENRDPDGNPEPDQYGNDGFVVQDIGKQRREAGERGPIIGNWKHADKGGNQRQGRDVPASEAMKKRDNQASEPDDCDEIPFNPRHAGLPV
jgi:hypothetical protein